MSLHEVANRRNKIKYRNLFSAVALGALSLGTANGAPPIGIVDSKTPTVKVPAKPGVYVGQKITFDDKHSGDVVVRVGVWDIKERMKKQMVQVGDPTVRPEGTPVSDDFKPAGSK